MAQYPEEGERVFPKAHEKVLGFGHFPGRMCYPRCPGLCHVPLETCFSLPGHVEQEQTTGAFLQEDSWGARSVRWGQVSGGQAETVDVPCHGDTFGNCRFPSVETLHPRASPPTSDGEVWVSGHPTVPVCLSLVGQLHQMQFDLVSKRLVQPLWPP